MLTALDGIPLGSTEIAITLIETGEQAVAMTGSDGHFAFIDIPAGDYHVVASHPGYAARDHMAPRSMLLGLPLTIAAGDQREMVDFRLAPAADLLGRVVNAGGEGVASATIEAVRPIFQDGEVALAMYGSTTAGADGVFRLRDLAAGQYYIRGLAPAAEADDDLGDDDASGAPRRFPTYYPSTTAASQATPVVVAPPTSPNPIELTLRDVVPTSVSGRIISGTAAPLLGGVVTMVPYVNGRVVIGTAVTARVELDGSFTFAQTPPGSFVIQARALDETTPRLQFATFSLTAGGSDLADVTMTLRNGAQIDGEVIVEGDAEVVDFETLTVRAPTADPSAVGIEPTALVRSDGVFSLPSMQDGPRFLRLDGLPAAWTLAEVLYQGRDVTDIALDLDSGEHLPDVRLIVRPGRLSLTGTLRTDRGGVRTDRTVVVFSVNQGYWAPYARHVTLAHPDPQGQFEFVGLPEGNYYVAVAEELDRSELFIGGRLQRLARIATMVDIGPGGASLDLTVPSPTNRR
ncbi:MAG: carboxypeptidase-like regulatory domain-containing protein [Vicinamibacterales bacterium]|nr:hypothetical protein [Acidobacteriota bacterium]MDP7294262.1 carboxypeptidase-like regulatory domain-containing protein [Vicinamibacterales bacterium]MDP7470944.1 carboxypeptidase-like regulatory domain-containing protein [Vicinamibacterales bacterium]HJO38621.1 carboxypeptidase-like regulatory domain-containing protein [Vicinamibacterales bacterium]